MVVFDTYSIENCTKTIYLLFYLIDFIDYCKYLHNLNLMPATHFKRGNNSTKLKDILFTVTQDKEKQQILTFEKLGPGNLWHFCSTKKLWFRGLYNLKRLFWAYSSVQNVVECNFENIARVPRQNTTTGRCIIWHPSAIIASTDLC